jgi:general secretion pathway protein K
MKDPRERTQRGIALISVLVVITLLAAIAAAAAAGVRQDTRVASNLLASARAQRAAEAGVYLALVELAAGRRESETRAERLVDEFQVGEALVRVVVRDESGKIDLNAAPQRLLHGLVAAAGVPEDERRRIVDAILDWRDADRTARPHGAEDPQYRAAGKPYGAKDSPFDSVEELQLVLGITPELFQALAGSLTVHSRQPGVIAQEASEQVLRAIPGGDPAELERYLAAREQRRTARLPPPPAPRSLRLYLTRNGSATFGIEAHARLPGGASARVSAIVDVRRPGPEGPFTVLEWRRAGPDLFADGREG